MDTEYDNVDSAPLALDLFFLRRIKVHHIDVLLPCCHV